MVTIWVRIAITLLFVGAFGGFGLLFITVAQVNRRRAKASQDWPITGGQIKAIKIEKRNPGGDEQELAASYEPVIQYEYDVMGQAYAGDRVSFGTSSFGLREAQTIISRYIPGMNVAVHYNPRNPEQAVLETGAPKANFYRAIGMLILLIGLTASCIVGLIFLYSM